MLHVRGLTSSPAGVLGLGLASIEMAIKAERDETEAGEEEMKHDDSTDLNPECVRRCSSAV